MEDEIDMQAAATTISEGLGFGEAEPVIEEENLEQDLPEGAELDAPETPDEPDVPDEPAARAAPKSWAKDQHETWGKLPKEAQDYIEHREKQMLDGLSEYKKYADFGRQLDGAIKPYEPMFQQAGVDVNEGIKYLLHAQYTLQTGSLEQKTQELQRIAKQYGVNLGAPTEEQNIDPNVKALQDKINQIEQGLTVRQQQEMEEIKAQKLAEVNEFASDPAHPYFEDVADDIVLLVKAKVPLKEAYEKAVWANPVTRQKELDRINKENVSKLREKARQEAEAAKKATGSNVRTRDTTKSPTEPKGKLFGEEHQAEMLAIVNKSKG